MTESPQATRADWSRAMSGVWSMLGAPHVLPPLAAAGFDWICLDTQHGRFDDRSVLDGLAALRDVPVPALVRVTELNAALIGRALDAGADGVIVPLVDTAAQAADAVRFTFYPPLGQRSWGPIGAAYDGTPADVNAGILCAVMVETPAGLAQLREIAATPGVGMIFVGPFDLSLALGVPVDELIADRTPDGPLQRIVRACGEAGIAAGVFAGTPERAIELFAHGFTVVAVTTDLLVLERGGAGLLESATPGT